MAKLEYGKTLPPYDPDKASGWMEYRRRRLLRHLEKAAHLHHISTLSETEYAVVALDTMLRWRRVRGERLPRQRDGLDFSWVDLALEMHEFIHGPMEKAGDVDVAEGHERYGPYGQAPMILRNSSRQGGDGWDYRWTSVTTKLLHDTEWKLSNWQRGENAVNAWLTEKRKRVPELFNIYTAIVGFIAGVLVTLWLKK